MTLPTPTQLPESGVETRPIEVVSPIKPSEALRLGRLTRPKEAAAMVLNGSTKACALGAMAIGYGMPDPGFVSAVDDTHDREVYEFVANIAFDGDTDGPDITSIWCANDNAKAGQRDAAVLAYLESRGL